jgi:exodeoxyribonuclease VII large subunit
MTARPNLPEFTVSEVSQALKRTVEEGFEHIRVRGEISGFKRHSSGHLYFCLKDSEAVMDACCWRPQAQRLGLSPEDGMEVVATGRLTTYPGRSKYQMIVERMELAGQGALLKLLEDRKRKLAAEGLFDAGRKRPLPFLPRVIGVVTSPTGAVIRDILHRLGDRFPRHVLLWPVAVQGESAAAQVAAAIAGFNAIAPGGAVPRPDVLIIARGGGSLEDLWAFNEEIVVRAAAASQIPLISAVGHETDTTLIDFAADRRAPTPTGAAEMAVPVRLDLVRQVSDAGNRLVHGLARGLEERRLRLLALGHRLPDLRRLLDDGRQRLEDRAERLGNALPNLLHRRAADLHRLAARLISPREQIAVKRHLLDQTALRLDHAARAMVARRQAEFHRCADRLSRRRIDQDRDRGGRDLAALSDRLAAALPRLLEERRGRLGQLQALLDSYSHQRVLERGFALVVDESGHPVMRAAAARPGAAWTVQFADDKVAVTVAGHAPPAKPRRKPADSAKQGSLF